MQKQSGIQLTEGEQRPQCIYGIKSSKALLNNP